ncbi:MAG: hypothetical protein F6K47_06775 [Symploca sp. SIO2E6]|nr:hypothetical protein [Symploca sp. SIO2E6]
MARTFQQLDGCLIFDEPLYPAYLTTQGFDHPHRLEIIQRYETNYERIISKITGNLPQGYSFSFQKHTANNLPKNLNLDWLMCLDNFFLIRHPCEIIVSRQNIYNYQKNFTLHEIGIEDMYNLFVFIQERTAKMPIVVDSTDLIKNPRQVLQQLCTQLSVDFSDKMLTWQSGIRETDPLWAKTWYKTLANSTGFIPFVHQEITVPEHLKPVIEECLPFYENLYHYRIMV